MHFLRADSFDVLKMCSSAALQTGWELRKAQFRRGNNGNIQVTIRNNAIMLQLRRPERTDASLAHSRIQFLSSVLAPRAYPDARS